MKGSVSNRYSASCWGQERFSLRLPVGEFRFHGLTTMQRQALVENYTCFLADTSLAHPVVVNCQACRLAEPVSVDIAELTVDGQYTPLKERNDRTLQITGLNFRARIEFGEGRVDCSLSVALESELVEAKVFENFLRIFCAHQALNLGGVMLHSAGLVYGGQAWLFVGRSGVGKTTLTRKAVIGGAAILSDDINLLLPDGNQYRAHPLPFMGDFGPLAQEHAASSDYPVAGVVLLRQGDCFQIEKISQADAMARLLIGSPFVNTDGYEANKLLDNLGTLIGKVPVLSILSARDDAIGDIMAALQENTAHDLAS